MFQEPTETTTRMPYKQENITPYQPAEDKTKQVEEMFNNIAPTYDRLNHRLSFSIDRWWRRRAIKKLMPHKPQRVLDVATGTGDLAIMMAEKLAPQHISAVDIANEMMKIGQQKAEKKGLADIIHFSHEDCMNLSFEDNTYDAVTAAFGIRNFSSLEQGIREMHRVLRPGGICCILELTHPERQPMKSLFRFYSHTLLPLYGRLISRDKRAYQYLTETIEAFPTGDVMMQLFHQVGFSKSQYRHLTFGICTLYIAEK